MPEMGAAICPHAIAPMKGGVTNEAVTSARTAPPNGMSLRATSHPIRAAKAQQITLEETAMMTVVISGSTTVGAVGSRGKVAGREAASRGGTREDTRQVPGR